MSATKTKRPQAAELDDELNRSIDEDFSDEEAVYRRRAEDLVAENQRQTEARAEGLKREMDGILADAKARTGAGTKSKRPANVYQPPPGNGTATLGGALTDPDREIKPRELHAVIPIASIERPAGNPRKHFDDAELQELAATIKTHGILQDLVVCPTYRLSSPSSIVTRETYWEEPLRWNTSFELVAGERRLRAAKLAGLVEVPVKILDLDKQQIAEIRLIENDQRKDLDPLERGAAYHDLTCNGWTVERIAERVGRSTGVVYGFIKLHKHLPDKARTAVQDGQLPATTAQLIARIPDKGAREKATKEILSGGHYKSKEPMSYRSALDLVQREFTIELKKAPFDPADAKLLASAGACTDCPKRAGNNRAEFPDARADVCTDPSCFQQKCRAYKDAKLAEAKATGKPVLSKSETKGLFQEYSPDKVAYNAPFIDLDDSEWIGNKQTTWRARIGKKLGDAVVLAVDPKGNLHELVPKGKAQAAVRKKAKLGSSSGSGGGDPGKAARDRDRAKREQEERVNGAVAIEAAAAIGRDLGKMPITGHQLEVLRLLVWGCLEEFEYGEGFAEVTERMGLKGKDADPEALAADCTSALALWVLLAEVMAQSIFRYSFSPDRKKVAASLTKELGLDVAAIKRRMPQPCRGCGDEASDEHIESGLCADCAVAGKLKPKTPEGKRQLAQVRELAATAE